MPNPAAYTDEDYLAAAQAHLPPGLVWPRRLDSVLALALAGMVPSLRRVADRARQLLVAESPAGTGLVELLPEWEASLGLPDPCSGPAPTIALRQRAVVARLTASGGQSVPYFIGVAAALGYSVSVVEFVPSRFGQPFGGSFGGDDWAHTWRVVAPQQTIVPNNFGSYFGEPFLSWGNAALECTLNRIKPAHTILQFAYGP